MKLMPSPERVLSYNEQQVLQLMCQGCSMEEISTVLLISQHTMEALKSSISKKLDTQYLAEAARKARVMNLI
jgi:DNA-binding NarL/FixJ family response regulator